MAPTNAMIRFLVTGARPYARGVTNYTWTQNTVSWGAKRFSTPLYRQFGCMKILFEDVLGDYGENEWRHQREFWN